MREKCKSRRKPDLDSIKDLVKDKGKGDNSRSVGD
jgi:hypothetical protein